MREIMKNDRALYLRENSGVVQALDNKAFDPKHVDAAFDYPRVNVRAMPPSEVFVCVDTAGGAPPSRTASGFPFVTDVHSQGGRAVRRCARATTRRRGNSWFSAR